MTKIALVFFRGVRVLLHGISLNKGDFSGINTGRAPRQNNSFHKGSSSHYRKQIVPIIIIIAVPNENWMALAHQVPPY
ncbi:hypothetical protein TNCV_2567251 [Trichonephila clavipes]|uniref:Uncharacterized protein n=1 Tax=Trichonephila clavipes TaxID=2585209 RepID=A0A8X6WKD7_TRICX|nr:hypothetical protein TNCV_2567251 [Trichonephila clavipes]